jgi:glutamyl/glutaminyl-tRNA synthetase
LGPQSLSRRHPNERFPGQDWGIPPQDPHALVVERYRPFRDLIAANMRHFGALRLDHVMALCRQWWVPVGLGAVEQDVAAEIGDFVLRRADGLWAYQLAVVVDDAAQGITDVVRGADLAGSTARQVVLARALGVPSPRWLHVPVVAGEDGDKLSKQNGATAIDAARPLPALDAAMRHLGFEPPAVRERDAWLAEATRRWAARFGPQADAARR